MTVGDNSDDDYGNSSKMEDFLYSSDTKSYNDTGRQQLTDINYMWGTYVYAIMTDYKYEQQFPEEDEATHLQRSPELVLYQNLLYYALTATCRLLDGSSPEPYTRRTALSMTISHLLMSWFKAAFEDVGGAICAPSS